MNSIRKELEALRVAIEEKSSRRNQALYVGYCQGILDKMADQSSKLSRFGSADEDLYDHCARLMAAYRATVNLYERFQADIINPEVREIIDGIITVLVSRLREFEEVTLDTDSDINSDKNSNPSKDLSTNPITAEKNAIITAAIKQMEAAIYENKNQLDKDALYEVYCQHLSGCQAELNDLNRRKSVQSFLALMEDELEILSTIIKIQIRALELAVEVAVEVDSKKETDCRKEAETDSYDKEKTAVHRILSLLREAYQHFGRASTEMAAVFHNFEDTSQQAAQSESESFQDFAAFLLTCEKQIQQNGQGQQSQIEDDGLEEQKALLKFKVEQEAEALINRYKLDFFKSVYHFRRMVADNMMLAVEMTNAFEKLRDDWPKEPEKLEKPDASDASDESDESDASDKSDKPSVKSDKPSAKPDKPEGTEILIGVQETLEIKVEGLREAISQMQDECTKLIENFTAKNAVEPSEEEITKTKEAVWQLWNQDPDNFIDICPDLPIFAERRASQEKNSGQCQDNLEKKLVRFKRETLLYEVSTYEEIILYSVSRLRELDQEECRQGAALADDTLKTIEVLLKKNNIEVIRPKPHDPFNSKEHEVLMAESNPEFKKGEIVKLMNSGYRQKDTVLLRANVIAAR